MNDDFIGGNSYKQTEEQLNAKKWMKIIGIILLILFVIAIALVGVMYYIESTKLKITLDGKVNTNLEKVFIFEEGKVYIPIRAFASYVNYSSGNDEYGKYGEDTTKCYVQGVNEVASFSLNTNKIYKIILDGNNNYEYYEIDEPVRMINNQLCTTIKGVQIAFNISMTYNKNKNQITIYTLPYLVNNYASKFKNSALLDNNNTFSNQKALLYNKIIIKNSNNNYGVNDLSGKEILGTKYANIKFIESNQEFIVTTLEGKMGIMSYDDVNKVTTTKISPEYDSIKQIDKNHGLYLVTNNGKQGIVNENGSIIIHLEYDQIGIDNKKYTTSDIKNQYLLYDKCIPVKRNNKWGLFDKTGRQITELKFDDFGCSAGAGTTSNITTNSILLVPKYEGIVIRENNLYGLIDSSGNQLLPTALKSIYSTTNAGEETYYMNYNETTMNVISYIQKYVKPEN